MNVKYNVQNEFQSLMKYPVLIKNKHHKIKIKNKILAIFIIFCTHSVIYTASCPRQTSEISLSNLKSLLVFSITSFNHS